MSYRRKKGFYTFFIVLAGFLYINWFLSFSYWSTEQDDNDESNSLLLKNFQSNDGDILKSKIDFFEGYESIKIESNNGQTHFVLLAQKKILKKDKKLTETKIYKFKSELLTNKDYDKSQVDRDGVRLFNSELTSLFNFFRK